MALLDDAANPNTRKASDMILRFSTQN
jgi:hypothetical protein